MALPEEIDFVKNPSASQARMQLAMTSLDVRLRRLETPAKSFDQQLATLQEIGLTRINEVLQPVYNKLTTLAELGTLLAATSGTSMPVQTGALTFVVDDVFRAGYAPPMWVSALAGGATAAMAGLVTSYDRDTGQLSVRVIETYGSGTFSNWQISPSSPPLLAAAVVDDGTFDGIGEASFDVPFFYSGQQAVKVGRVTVADVDYAVLSTDVDVQLSAISASRTVTLPRANTIASGARLQVGDASGSASALKTITLALQGPDTINGSTSYAVNQPFGQVTLESDGASTWTILAQTTSAPTIFDDGTF